MELVITFTVRLRKVFFVNLFKIVKIVWTFWINKFAYSEKLAVILRCKSVGTMRAEQSNGVGGQKLMRISRTPCKEPDH